METKRPETRFFHQKGENKSDPHRPVMWDKHEHFVRCTQNLTLGTASDEDQKFFMEALVYGLCGAMDLEYRQGGDEGDRASAFAGGKRWIGLQLVQAINYKLGTLNNETK